MAYAALVTLSRAMEQIMSHHQDYASLANKEQMESVHSSIVFLQQILEGFPKDQNSAIKQMESRITRTAYQMEDIIECEISDLATRTAMLSGSNPSPFRAGWISFTLRCFHIDDVAKRARRLSLRRMFSNLGSCIEEVNSIVEDVTKIKSRLEMMKDMVGHGSLTASSSNGSPIGKNKMVGLDTDLIHIQERLVGYNRQLHIISIVGMGGIGKTTLARSAFEDPLTVEYFDVRIWLTISQEYNAQNILQKILSVSGKNLSELESNRCSGDIERVYKSLIGWRFLVVFDDTWDAKAWELVRSAFPDANNGSRVILTTRLVEVAIKVDSSSPLHEMRLLNEHQSWNMLRQEVFGQKHISHSLEKTGKVIARRCNGLPLAIFVVAGLLKLNLAVDYWERCAKNIKEATTMAPDDQLYDILSLSYDNLPPHLKPCFMYIGMFPEDQVISCKRPIKLWAADGFLKSKRDKSMEDVAEEYLLDLVERNLIFLNRRRSNGEIRSFTIHDVLRELSIRKAEEEKFLKQFTRRYNPKNTNSTFLYPRRISVNTFEAFRYLRWNSNCKPVRSLIFFRPFISRPFFPKFRLLRVLDVLPILFRLSDLNIFSLVNLRYLAFTYKSVRDGMQRLESINHLVNLETLIVNHVSKVNVHDYPELIVILIPILELPKLRHFILIHSAMPTRYLIDEVGESRSFLNSSQLQTFSGVNNYEFTTRAIEIFGNLVKVKIKYLNINLEGDLNKYYLDNLVHLHQLEELSLEVYGSFLTCAVPLLRENVAFPKKLKKLSLTNFRVSWKKTSVIGSLPNLEVLKFNGCTFGIKEREKEGNYFNWEPVEGEFVSLKYLKLNVQDLVELKVEFAHFPCLEQLIVSSCYMLEEVPSEVGEMYTLKKLIVEDCPASVGNSAKKIQEEQHSHGNNVLEVLVVEGRKRPRTDRPGEMRSLWHRTHFSGYSSNFNYDKFYR